MNATTVSIHRDMRGSVLLNKGYDVKGSVLLNKGYGEKGSVLDELVKIKYPSSDEALNNLI